MKAYEVWRDLPYTERSDVRARRCVDLSKSDREIFASLDTGDLWLDARVHECFLYLYGSSNCVLLCCKQQHHALSLKASSSGSEIPVCACPCHRIPDSWIGVMENFKAEVLMKVPCQESPVTVAGVMITSTSSQGLW